jgi:hypothetical protein
MPSEAVTRAPAVSRHTPVSPRDALVPLLFLGISLALNWRLLAGFSTTIPSDAGDPVLNTWILWWNAQHFPWHAGYFHAPVFAPAPNALALSETLLGLAWLTTPLQWLGASPLEAYNTFYLLTPVLNGVSSYALCLALTGRRDAALVGSLYFTLAPLRAGQASHLQTQAAFFMPLALLALHRFWETRDRRWLLLLGLATFSNGAVSGYHLLYFGVAAGLVLVWLAVSSFDAGKLLAAGGTLAVALLGLVPLLWTYRQVHAAWGLERGLEEMAIFSADVSSFLIGAPTLLLWSVPHFLAPPKAEVYPGVAMLALLGAGLISWLRDPATHQRWRSPVAITRVRQLLLAVASAGLLAAIIGWARGPTSFTLGPLSLSITQLHKPLGLALNALVIAAALSPRLWVLARAGSPPALYGTLFVISAILMLGPDGEFLGHRFWYKAPFAWLVELPGFNSVRVPARMSSIQILAASVLCAWTVRRLWNANSRARPFAVGAICVALALDGWFTLKAVPVPGPLPVSVRADLVIELPTRGWAEDVAAMYRGIQHARPVVNGYSGYPAPHYEMLLGDLKAGCLDSLNGLRRGRSLDVILWRSDPQAEDTYDRLVQQWPAVPIERTDAAIVFRVPGDRDRAETAHDDPIDLRSYCRASRTSPPAAS